jgi:GT2 family glycosyltransferase/glycosyltransferase involved in cell wall biosynthesis/SAM-dependent methyltransferase
MNPKASLIILTFNNLKYTRMCLESIYAKTDEPSFELVLVDNASSDGTPQYLREFAETHANVRLVLNPLNQGFARGNNTGAAEASGEVLIFLNNDIVVTRGWLSGLLPYLEDQQIGMVGPVTNASGNESRIPVDYEDLADMDVFAERYTQAHQGQAFEIRMLPFQCVAIRREVYDQIGPLDERFGIGMFEDDDYALRLKQAGYKILCAQDVYVHHWGSASFSRLEFNTYWDLFKGNLKKFEEKWGIRWLPHTPRGEFIPEQFRQMLDATMWLTDVAAEREQVIKQQEGVIKQRDGLIDDLHVQLQDQVNAVSRLDVQLRDIYNSNGWRFLQTLLRFRRMIIPEGSRRERVFRQGILTVRNFNLSQVKSLLSEFRGSLRKDSQVRAPVPQFQVQNLEVSREFSWLPEHFPWPLASVILPVYNHADMLEGAARSVLHNTYPNLELIILDDGSTDDIEPVLTRLLNNPRVRVYRQPNQKLPRALTHAHQYARGQFITWTSSDNLLAPTAYERLVNALLAHPEAVLVYADVNLIDDENRPLNDETHRPQNQDPYHPDILHLYRNAEPLGYEADNYISACFMYRREAATALEGYYAEDLPGLEDYDFWLRLQKSGPFYHIENNEPLYYYRVHTRTMSHDLLSQAQERDAHIQRIQNLIDYEKKRRQFVQKRWSFGFEQTLSTALKTELTRSASRLPVDIQDDSDGREHQTKKLRFVSSEVDVQDPIYVQALPDTWKLVWESPHSEGRRTLSIWKGIEISPLAYKTREYRCNKWEFPQAGNRPVIGFHESLADFPVDVSAIRRFIQNNPAFFFVFADIENQSNPDLGSEIVKDLENAVYLGARPFGDSYQLYACFSAVWAPPFTREIPECKYRSLLALAYAIGRPLLAPPGMNFTPAPYQYTYQIPDESLAFLNTLDRKEMDVPLLDLYLEQWKPEQRLGQLTKYADTILQEKFLTRPDFGIVPAIEKQPERWTLSACSLDRPFKVGIAVNSLDKGGLENLVAQLALRFQGRKIDVFVLCFKKGGTTAISLYDQGVHIHLVNESKSLAREILEREKPDVINTHLADIEVLAVAEDLGIPIVETIHSSYIWLDRGAWLMERQRSSFFSQAIATSQTTLKYYAKHNPAFRPDWISIVPTGIETQNIEIIDKKTARKKLELPEKDFIFINVASYDGVKNQLGLLTAFEQVHGKNPDTRLLCVGNIANPEYHQKVQDYHATLKSREKIDLFEYRQDVGELLSAADAFVLDSFSEGWSLAATEALLAGIPVIHSDCGSALELVGQGGERGIVVPNPICSPIDLNREVISRMMEQKRQANTDELASAMLQMVEEKADWEFKRTDIRAYALNHFDISHMVVEYIRIFQTVTNLKIPGESPSPLPAPETQLFSQEMHSNGDVTEKYDPELEFWDKELSLQGEYSESILNRSIPERMRTEFPSYTLAVIEQFWHKNNARPRVLDIGSGPLSMFAFGSHDGIIDLVAADPLADKYKELLDKYHYNLNYPLVKVLGEELSSQFGEQSFEIVWIHNALDHSKDPAIVLKQMAKVLKPGGYMYFQGWSREGTAEGWLGLHQHDIYLAPGNRLICESRIETENGPSVFAHCINAELPLQLIESSEPSLDKKTWVKMVWRKPDTI